FPRVNCYQPPVVWDRADGFQVFDKSGNCWIDFSSTAVMTNTGHAHPRVRQAIVEYAESGMLAHFSFAAELRVELAKKLIEIAPPGLDKVYFWTTGSEALESAFRLCREFGRRAADSKHHLLCIDGDYHGCTFGAHQISGGESDKPWVRHPDPAIHRLSFPTAEMIAESGETWDEWVARSIGKTGVEPAEFCGVFVETIQGWGAIPLPTGCVQAIRRWADAHQALLVFDEVQTGFGRTGKWFGHQHYGVRADLLCVGKGITSTLPLAAVLGPADVLDVLAPGEVTTTHAGHPLSCAAALANLEVLSSEGMIEHAAEVGEIVRRELSDLRASFPRYIANVSGLGLLNALHITDPKTRQLSKSVASELTGRVVRRGVMLFRTGKPSIKSCPPLVIPAAAAVDGVRAIGEALDRL
ncbi:MAG: aspartate aminotransferase family protein, partial [Pirellulaceae bacterium]|nr:aspartate aminotransferase family protein [Pirellulaceae bacterium]